MSFFGEAPGALEDDASVRGWEGDGLIGDGFAEEGRGLEVVVEGEDEGGGWADGSFLFGLVRRAFSLRAFSDLSFKTAASLSVLVFATSAELLPTTFFFFCS